MSSKALRHFALIAFVAAALVSTQFAVTVHELTTRHAICAQHGDLVDLDSSSGQPSSVAGSGGKQLVSVDEPLQEHHEHCLFVSSQSTRHAFRLAKLVESHFPSIVARTYVAHSESWHGSGSLYLAAPKHS